VRFAVNIPNFGPYADAAAVAELAATAEEAGWDGFFVWDHIVVADAMPVGDPWVMLTAVAMATERLIIGPMVTPLPRRRPWVVARQTVTLDRLSGGRLVLGVGIGVPAHVEFGTFGEPTGVRERAEMLDEALDVIVGMWSGEPFSYRGKHFHVDETTFMPKPVQRPHIPIWVAGTWPNKGPFRRAARFDGAFPLADDDGATSLISPDGVAEVVAYVAGQRDDDGGDYEMSAAIVLTGDAGEDQRVLAEFAEAGVTWAQLGPNPDGGDALDGVADWIAGGPPRL
jgi:alkanesulfonate monooxygenase SsuD/methylene tetrahydromethanopterin reductase-like flavin-dependent oxidoreductase (luciferase family)